MPLSPGARLGPYEILAPLGAGGMGEVYRARDSRLGREVAVKVLPAQLAKDPEALQRFEREAKAVAALSHPNILAIHDFGAAGGVSYAVMELLQGENLRSRVTRSALAWRRAVEIAVAVADGLSAAHSKEMIHRDLKPENIFLTDDGQVKILDFGLARSISPKAASPASAATESLATLPGTVLGTLGYMSPEQVRGEDLDARSDIFSLGCVLYEMLAGQRAFSRPTAAETMSAILREEPAEIKDSGKQISPELSQLTARCLEKNPQERFHSAHDLAFALRATLRGSGASRPAAPRRSKALDSLAVLPFLNAGDDPNAEYLSDGITESLINSLSQLPKVRVTARSTVFRYKGKDVDPQTVGRELNVRALLMGRVVGRGDTLSIQADLVDAADGSQLWGDRYHRKASDIFAIEEEIARQISEKLRAKLTGEDKKRLAKRHTANTEAYQLYLKGRYYWNKRTKEAILKGIEYFQQAIEKDPRYALAYVGLADSYATLGVYGECPPAETIPKWKAMVAKALEIDPTLSEAHSSQAMVCGIGEGDWQRSDQEHRRALELNPNNAVAHHYYAHNLEGLGRLDEAIAAVQRGLELDPLSLVLNAHLGLALYFARRYDSASEQLRKTLEIDPHFVNANLYLAYVCSQQGRHEQALAAAQRAVEASPGSTMAMSALGYAYAASGQRSAAQKLIADLKELAGHRYVSPFDIAVVYAGLGDKDEAFEWFERAFADRSTFLSFLRVNPAMDSLRSDPRFPDLVRRMGLES